ncbi:MAG: hypothetical protein ABEJ99_03595 [Candidatus Nanohaloarchaea archaeon]
MNKDIDAKAILGLTGLVAFATLAVVSSYGNTGTCSVDFSKSSDYLVTNQTVKAELRDSLFDRPSVRVSEGVENGADKSDTVAYYLEEQDQFYVVQHGTIAGNQFYGPFNGDPGNCVFTNWP